MERIEFKPFEEVSKYISYRSLWKYAYWVMYNPGGSMISNTAVVNLRSGNVIGYLLNNHRKNAKPGDKLLIDSVNEVIDGNDPALVVISKNRLAVEAKFEGGYGLLVVNMDAKKPYTIKISIIKYFAYMNAIGDTGIITISTSYTLLFVDLVKGAEILKASKSL